MTPEAVRRQCITRIKIGDEALVSLDMNGEIWLPIIGILSASYRQRNPNHLFRVFYGTNNPDLPFAGEFDPLNYSSAWSVIPTREFLYYLDLGTSRIQAIRKKSVGQAL